MSDLMFRDELAIAFLDALRPRLEKLDIYITYARWLVDSTDNPRSLEINIDDQLAGEQTKIWVPEWNIKQWYQTPSGKGDQALDSIINDITFDLDGETEEVDYASPYEEYLNYIWTEDEPLTYRLSELPVFAFNGAPSAIAGGDNGFSF